MPDKNISIGEAFKFAWDAYKSNIGYFIKVFVIITVIYILGATSIYTTRDTSSLPSSIISIANSFLEIVISIGLLKISVDFVRGKKPLLTDLFSSYRLFFKAVASSIIYSLIVLLGLILFIIPGIIWSLKLSQFAYFIIDKKSGPIQALKESAKITQGVKWELLGFIIVAFVINMFGFMFFVVGILVTAPITMLARAHVYQQLLDQEKPAATNTSFATPPQSLTSISKPKQEQPPTPEPETKPTT